jgi:hypothetical protein
VTVPSHSSIRASQLRSAISVTQFLSEDPRRCGTLFHFDSPRRNPLCWEDSSFRGLVAAAEAGVRTALDILGRELC